MLRLGVALALVLVVGSSGGCASSGWQPTLRRPPAPSAEIHEHWPGCYDLGAFGSVPVVEQPEFGRGAIPDDFTPVTAVRCAYGDTDQTFGEGLERRAADPAQLQLLLDYLARPSETVPFPNEQPCAAMAWYPPWLFLVDANGRWIRPQIPTDVCGFPLDLWARDDQLLPYDRLLFTDTLVCRQTGDPPECRPV